MNPSLDWSALRKDFPILDQKVHGKPLVYFDNAATSQKPRAVIDALVHYYEHDNANVHRGIHELSNRATNSFEAARTRTAKFINAKSADEIIFTRGTTEGINLVASSWGLKNLKAGDVILLTEMEHHSNLVPWQMLAQKTGAKISYVPVTGDEGLLELSKLESLLTPRVKIFSMVHISNSLGTLNPVAELCARARELGIVTLVDGAQSAGHLPVDVQAIGCDFFAFSGHKICGPTGIGVLW
ncbi:MAG TPA: aminotransferase class V-fold PLP-dependent enzyme, partial [Candidatus Limnocylindrales bacterium]|nr:aminotransferase class V-fold PLP-dependent enzyme [Candidatus Limnocylindrales bacterium]